jgi:hypothetical protein
MFVRFYQIAIFASLSIEIVFRACGDGGFWTFGRVATYTQGFSHVILMSPPGHCRLLYHYATHTRPVAIQPSRYSVQSYAPGHNLYFVV